MSLAACAMGIGWAGLVAFLIIRAVRQYSRYELLSPLPPASDGSAPLVHIIVPARNEAANIERCVSSLLAQNYPHDRIGLTVIDDGSTDATAAVVAKLAATDERLHLINGSPLPPGWAGKPHACWQGAQEVAADWLCFIDADTIAEPALLITATTTAQSRGIDMLSLEPFQVLGTSGERLILPAGFFLLAFSQDLGRVNDPHLPDAAANGQFILIRRSVYDAIGGHAGVRAELSEDSAMAKLVKRHGHRLALIGAESLIRTRMFRGFASLWEGLSRSACDTVGGPGWTIFFAFAGLLLATLTFAAPLVTAGALRRHSPASDVGFVAAMSGSLALFGVHIGAARHFRIPLFYGLLFPLGYCLAAMVGFSSASRHLRGRVAWKGRVYAPPEASA